MTKAKTYLQNELQETEPQKIISHFVRTRLVKKDEPILSVLGGTSFLGIYSTLLSTDDRIIYLNNSSVVAKTTIMPYSDIVSIALLPDENRKKICIQLTDGQTIKVDLKALNEDFEKMYAFLSEYKPKGEELAKIRHTSNKSLLDQEYDLKLAENHKHYQEKYNKEHQEIMAKIDEVGNKKFKQHYRLFYSSGLADALKPGLADITLYQLNMEIVFNGNQINIPFDDIKGSTISIEKSTDPKAKELLHYLSVSCKVENRDCDIVFSIKQRPDLAKDPIRQLNYSLNHLEENVEATQGFFDRCDQKEKQLSDQRQELLAQRSNSIEKMRKILNQDSDSANIENVTHSEMQKNPLGLAGNNTVSELRELKSLLDDGIITQEEFDAKKKQLLGL